MVTHPASPVVSVERSCAQDADIEAAREANAEFIVRACNSHTALVEALEDAKAILDRGDAATMYSERREWLYRQTFARVCAAIALARGETQP
jgi:hypothetical protein